MKHIAIGIILALTVSAWAQSTMRVQQTTAPPPVHCPVGGTQYWFYQVAETNGTNGAEFDSSGWALNADGTALQWTQRTGCNAVFLMLDGSSVVFDPTCYNPDAAAAAFWAAVQTVVKAQAVKK